MSLLSWNETKTKQAILDFVTAVTSKGSPDYVPPVERIATFDNDGTLWCEQPVPAQFISILDGLAMLVKQNPALGEKPLYRAAANKDMTWFAPYLNNERLPELLGMMLEAAAGYTQAQFEARSTAWLKTARHSRFNKSFLQLIYQPMVELLDYLRVNDFRVFIVSGGGMDFVRLFSEEVYGIPRENVVGGNIMLSWEYRNGKPTVVRQAGIIHPYCDGPGKPLNIQLHVGRPPILTCGNTNGDVAMMEFAAATGKPYLNLLVHHDDAEREYNSEHSSEVALKTAKERNWTIVSIKEDFKTVFPE
jgi:phosphoglycolate phosphatase-like HAD superfamily hydrolase